MQTVPQPCWQELFTLFPSLLLRVPLALFFQLLPLIKPRYYRSVIVSLPAYFASDEDFLETVCVVSHNTTKRKLSIDVSICLIGPQHQQ